MSIGLNPKWTLTMAVLSREAPKSLKRYGEPSTTILNRSRLQVMGSRSGSPLTSDVEGEDIVFSRPEKEWCLA